MNKDFIQHFRELLQYVADNQDKDPLPRDWGATKVRFQELCKMAYDELLAENNYRPMPNVLPSQPFAVIVTEPLFGASLANRITKETDTFGNTIVYNDDSILLVDNRTPGSPPVIGCYLWVPTNGQLTRGTGVVLDAGVKEATFKLTVTGTRLEATATAIKV